MKYYKVTREVVAYSVANSPDEIRNQVLAMPNTDFLLTGKTNYEEVDEIPSEWTAKTRDYAQQKQRQQEFRQ